MIGCFPASPAFPQVVLVALGIVSVIFFSLGGHATWLLSCGRILVREFGETPWILRRIKTLWTTTLDSCVSLISLLDIYVSSLSTVAPSLLLHYVSLSIVCSQQLLVWYPHSSALQLLSSFHKRFITIIAFLVYVHTPTSHLQNYDSGIKAACCPQKILVSRFRL